MSAILKKCWENKKGHILLDGQSTTMLFFVLLVNNLVQKLKSFVFASQRLCLPTCDSSRCWWMRGLGCSLKFWGCVWSWHLTAKHGGNKKISPQELTIALSAEHSESAPLIQQQRQAMRTSCMRSWTCSCLTCVRSLPVAVQPGTCRSWCVHRDA